MTHFDCITHNASPPAGPWAPNPQEGRATPLWLLFSPKHKNQPPKRHFYDSSSSPVVSPHTKERALAPATGSMPFHGIVQLSLSNGHSFDDNDDRRSCSHELSNFLQCKQEPVKQLWEFRCCKHGNIKQMGQMGAGDIVSSWCVLQVAHVDLIWSTSFKVIYCLTVLRDRSHFLYVPP